MTQYESDKEKDSDSNSECEICHNAAADHRDMMWSDTGGVLNLGVCDRCRSLIRQGITLNGGDECVICLGHHPRFRKSKSKSIYFEDDFDFPGSYPHYPTCDGCRRNVWNARLPRDWHREADADTEVSV